jgi:hypothetical protein
VDKTFLRTALTGVEGTDGNEGRDVERLSVDLTADTGGDAPETRGRVVVLVVELAEVRFLCKAAILAEVAALGADPDTERAFGVSAVDGLRALDVNELPAAPVLVAEVEAEAVLMSDATEDGRDTIDEGRGLAKGAGVEAMEFLREAVAEVAPAVAGVLPAVPRTPKFLFIC